MPAPAARTDDGLRWAHPPRGGWLESEPPGPFHPVVVRVRGVARRDHPMPAANLHAGLAAPGHAVASGLEDGRAGLGPWSATVTTAAGETFDVTITRRPQK